MPRDGSGVYTKAANTEAVTNDPIASAKYNTATDDFVTDANTARPVVAGGTGATSASTARTSLGVEIGADVQAHDALLDALAALSIFDGNIIYGTGTGTLGTFTSTAVLRSFSAAATVAAQRTALGLGAAATKGFLDEDTMTSNSATSAPSQQSVKTYVDNRASIGISQSYQDVSGSRSVGTDYTNSTGRPIHVAITLGGGSSGDVEVSSDGITWVKIYDLSGAAGERLAATFIVPDGHEYRVLAGSTISSWAELR